MKYLNVISLIGKSNVGKSSLFNILIKKKQSIVSKKFNTTLNRNYGILKIKNLSYNIIDTGGYIGVVKNDKIYKKIYKQIILSIKESDLILLIVDVIEKINYLDKELYLIIKKYNKNFFLVINKIDIKKKHKNIYDFYNFEIDYKKIFFISCTHNIGIKELLKSINIFFIKKKNIYKVKKNNINISILGIPNSGKSTFINSFFREKNKSIVNNLAGTTIDTLYFQKVYNEYILTLIDTPGIIKKFKYNHNQKLFLLNTKKIIKKSDICILIIDIFNNVNKNDLFIKKLILKYKKGIIIIFNKCDLLNKEKILLFKKKNNYYFNEYIPKYYYSLKYNFKEKEINNFIKLIIKIFLNKKKKILTSFLNKNLLLKINNKNIKINNKNLKIKFCYQVKDKNFPNFIFYTNLKKKINLNYIKYIEKIFRKYIYNFYGVPIELIFKKKNNVKNIFYKKK